MLKFFRMDQSAVGHDYIAKVEKHVSQKDYSAGFGGKFGVQTDRIDKVRIINFFAGDVLFLKLFCFILF